MKAGRKLALRSVQHGPAGPAGSCCVQLGLLSGWRLSAMIAGVAQFKSQLTARAATRPSSKMAKKMPTASTDVSTLPRRSDFAEGAGGDDEWCREIEKKSDNYGKACRAKTTSDEHDMYFWGFSEYANRQGFGSYAERTAPGELPPISSGTGMLKPTYDGATGEMRVAPWQVVLAFMLDLGSGSAETPKGGHPCDVPWRMTAGWLRRRASWQAEI